ncbi:hypothetical protein [Candidatus Vondammii sp. HM_W22]|nr:hypothetical protein [Candidatus Vondammii sp. HM_W22]
MSWLYFWGKGHDKISVDKLVKRYRNSLAITGRWFDHMVKEAPGVW